MTILSIEFPDTRCLCELWQPAYISQPENTPPHAGRATRVHGRQVAEQSTISASGAPDTLFAWASVLAVAIGGVGVFTIAPLLVGALTEAGRLTGIEIGWVAAADTLGMLLVAVGGPLWVKRIAWRASVNLGLLLMLTANLASLWLLETFAGLLIVRILAGLGTGLAYCIAIASLGAHAKSERAFGWLVATQVAYGVVSLGLLPLLLPRFGVPVLFVYLSVWTMVALALSLFGFPHNQKLPGGDGMRFMRRIWRPAASVFLGLALYYVAMGGVWAYIERVGDGVRLPTKVIGQILMIGYALSFFGAIACERVTDKIGRARTLLLAGVVQILTLVALLWMDPGSGLLVYAAATIVYQFFWSFALPAIMAIFNGVDASGRIVVLAATAFKTGEFIGPPLMATGILAFGLPSVSLLGALFIVAGMGVLLVADSRYATQADT